MQLSEMFDRHLPSRLFETSQGPNGEVFHGSKVAAIRSFERRPGTRTAWFTASTVETHGFFFALNPRDAAEFGPHVSAYHLRLQKPLLGQDGIRDEAHRRDIEFVIEALFERVDDTWLVFHGSLNDVELQVDAAARDPDWIYDFLGHEAIHTPRGDLIHGRLALDWEVLDHAACVARMRARGYDGTLVYEKHLSAKLSWFVVDPHQIEFVRALS